MSDAIRRLYNRVEMGLDRRALRAAIHEVRTLGGGNAPSSVSAAFVYAHDAAMSLDSSASLKMIAAPDGTNREGLAARWEFLFDLPERMAKLTCDWLLPWDETADEYASAQLVVRAEPFPPEDNLLRRMVADGKLLYAQLRGQWRKEVGRTPALPVPFDDFSRALEDVVAQGLAVDDTEFSVATGVGPAGDASWIVASRDRRYHARLKRG